MAETGPHRPGRGEVSEGAGKGRRQPVYLTYYSSGPSHTEKGVALRDCPQTKRVIEQELFFFYLEWAKYKRNLYSRTI